MDKRIFKKSQEELEQYLQFKRRGSIVKNKKGKGSFKRNSKHKNRPDYEKEDWTMDRDIDDFIFGNEEPMCSDK